MKKLIFFFVFLSIHGCSIFQPEESNVIQPKLLKQTELPPIKSLIYKDNFEFFCEMLIDENGNVEQAKMLTNTGDNDWDSLAVQSLLSWKFTPATINGSPVKLLIRRKVMVVFEQPKIISLAEIMFDNYEQADSVYKDLLNGADFYELALIYSISPSRSKKGFLGNVNVNHYSDDISFVLKRLEEGNFTAPLRYGKYFVIFKCLKHNNL